AAVGPSATKHKNDDAFVGKLSLDGTSFVYLGYLGGDLINRDTGIALDPQNNAYLVGLSQSDETSSTIFGGFPATIGPDVTFNGFSDVFVAKVNPAGTSLVYCGYIGGALEEGHSDQGKTS